MSEHKSDAGSGTRPPAKPAQIPAPRASTSPGASHAPPDPTDPSLGSASLQAPWRLEYLERLSEEEKKSAGPAGPAGAAGGGGGTGCFLRDYWLNPDCDVINHVVVRARDGFILLNKFPYANGHLLVALAEGKARLGDYSAAQRAALWRLTDAAVDLMETTLEPQGVNIGVNQGRAAGAGVPQHLHVHLVPRWAGDVNFMTVVGRVRVLPASLETMAARYRAAWLRIRGRWDALLDSP